MTGIKQPQNEQQKEFLDLIIRGASVPHAAEEADYTLNYAYNLASKYKDYVLDGVQGLMYLSAVKAGNVVVGSMDSDGSVPDGKLRLDAAKDVLDRVGLSKQDRVKLEVEGQQKVFILPAKEDADSS